MYVYGEWVITSHFHHSTSHSQPFPVYRHGMRPFPSLSFLFPWICGECIITSHSHHSVWRNGMSPFPSVIPFLVHFCGECVITIHSHHSTSHSLYSSVCRDGMCPTPHHCPSLPWVSPVIDLPWELRYKGYTGGWVLCLPFKTMVQQATKLHNCLHLCIASLWPMNNQTRQETWYYPITICFGYSVTGWLGRDEHFASVT